jgi:hypothetical protein
LTAAHYIGLTSFGHCVLALALLCISIMDAFLIPHLARLVFSLSLFGACAWVWFSGMLGVVQKLKSQIALSLHIIECI